jgi:HD-like signal output (HDOD) protein
MTATILKLVNSAFFGLRRAVTCPDEAAAYLGIDLLKAPDVGGQRVLPVRLGPGSRVSVDGLWHHSMAVAVAARRIAQWEGVPMSVANESFTAGVLHDAGQLILVSSFPDEYAQVPRLIQSNGHSEREAERLVFGASHVEVGGYLFGLWGLPEPVVTAIALHDRPGLSPERRFGPLTTVHVANALVREASAITAVVTPPPVDEAYLREIGLLDRLPAWRAELTTPSTPFPHDAREHSDPLCR